MAIIPTETRDLGNNDYSNYCSLNSPCYRFAYIGTTGQHLSLSAGRTEVRMLLYCATTLEEVKTFCTTNSISFDFENWEDEQLKENP